MKARVTVHSDIVRSPRIAQVEGMFDVPRKAAQDIVWDVDLAVEDREWAVGAIIGPSGSGKSTVARAVFGVQMTRHENLLEGLRASKGSLLDAFPAGMSIKDIVAALSAVGFSSPPAWLRRYGVLSNGEQFRVSMAAALAYDMNLAAEDRDIVVVDEFTSVVDRTVARIGSAAIGKAVRRSGQRFVAVTCHEDITDWLQPDWVYRPAEQSFAWRSVQPRPRVDLTIYRVQHGMWARFCHHHYLTHELNRSAVCFAAVADFGEEMGKRLVCFDSWLPFVGRLNGGRGMMRSHRVVCLPDYQGIGIANAVQDFTASMWLGLGKRAVLGTSHPGFIAARKRSKLWKMTAAPSMSARDTKDADKAATRAADRLMARFEYIGPAMDKGRATRLLNNWSTRL